MLTAILIVLAVVGLCYATPAMSALGADVMLKFATGMSDTDDKLPVKASSTIYQGSMLGSSSGAARALVGGDAFMGFAMESATGGGTDGAVQVRRRAKGLVVKPVTGVDGIDDIGKAVYAANDNDLTLASTGGSLMGKVHRYLGADFGGSTVCEVYFEATSHQV